MNILLVNKYWHPKGGAEKVAIDTYHLLTQAGHDVRVFGMKSDHDAVENPDGIPYVGYNNIGAFKKISVGIKAIYNADAARRFAFLIDEWHPDVVHFHNISHQLSYALLGVVKKKRVPAVMTLHDYSMISPNYIMFHHGRIDASSVGGRYYRCLLNNCMEDLGRSAIATIAAYARRRKKWASAIGAYIAPTQFLLAEHVKAGMPQDRFHHIPYPVSFGTAPPNFGIAERHGVLYVGRLVKEKGVDTLLNAAPRLPEIQFDIIGEGAFRTSLELMAKKLRLTNVCFQGYQSSEQVKEAMRHARLIIIPSVWYETPSLVSIEAAANGTLPLGSDIGAIPEVLPPDLLFPAGDSAALAKRIVFWYNRSEQAYIHTTRALFTKLKQIHNPATYTQRLEELYGAL